MPAPAPKVRLGTLSDNGIAASIFVLVERGAERRPAVLDGMVGKVELCFEDDIDPVRIEFRPDDIWVEDGAWEDPDVRIRGRLPHIVQLTTASTVGGLPNPAVRSGRAALGGIARRRVRITGSRALGRRLLQLLRI